MPAWDREYGNTPTVTTTLVTTAETVVLSQAINAPQPNSSVVVAAHIVISTGTGVTSVTYRVRRASLTGTQIYTSGNVVIAASTAGSFDLLVVDNAPGDVASGLYVVTATQNAATGNGTVQLGSTIVCSVFT